MVSILEQGLYEENEFVGDNAIASILFPQLQLTIPESMEAKILCLLLLVF